MTGAAFFIYCEAMQTPGTHHADLGHVSYESLAMLLAVVLVFFVAFVPIACRFTDWVESWRATLLP